MATFSDSDFEAACSFVATSLGVLELNNYQKQSLKAIVMAETCLFPFLPGLESHYVSKVCCLSGISSFSEHSEKMLSQYY